MYETMAAFTAIDQQGGTVFDPPLGPPSAVWYGRRCGDSMRGRTLHLDGVCTELGEQQATVRAHQRLGVVRRLCNEVAVMHNGRDAD